MSVQSFHFNITSTHFYQCVKYRNHFMSANLENC